VRQYATTVALVAIAAAAAVVPLPPDRIEHLYSRGVYPAVQQKLTLATNTVPIALFDVAIALLLLALVSASILRVRRMGVRRAAGRTLVTLIRVCAVIYLAFLALWGLNYRRVPLEQKLDYDRARMTRDSVLEFANRAAEAINSGYQPAHASRVELSELGYHFRDAESKLGSGGATVPGIPKRSLLSLYFRRAAIDGMTDPIFLEIIINPDVLDIERPMVVAHEWGHLAGYANESEANFIAWLTCVRGNALAQYSAWLSAYEHAVRALPRQERPRVTPLEPGPREDLRAMAARYARSSPIVRQAAERVYDDYLRANRVPEGIGSYDAVLRLMVGTRFDRDWIPAMR
jgi:hypothetical protein